MTKILSEKDYKNLYLKYKVKYNKLKNMSGGEPFKWEIINARGGLEELNDSYFSITLINSLREVDIDGYKFNFIDLKCIIPRFNIYIPEQECDIKLLSDMKTWQFKTQYEEWQNFKESINESINEKCIIKYNDRNYKFYSGKLTIPQGITDKPEVIKLKQTDLKLSVANTGLSGAAEESIVLSDREQGERRALVALAKIRSDRQSYDKEYYLDFSREPILPTKFKEYNNLRLCVGYGDYIRDAEDSSGKFREMPNTEAYPNYDVYLIWSEYDPLVGPEIFNIPANIKAIESSKNSKRIICDVNLLDKKQVDKFTEMFKNKFKSIHNVSNGPSIIVEDAVKLLAPGGIVKISKKMHSATHESYKKDSRFKIGSPDDSNEFILQTGAESF